jgi:hypothetical protein
MNVVGSVVYRGATWDVDGRGQFFCLQPMMTIPRSSAISSIFQNLGLHNNKYTGEKAPSTWSADAVSFVIRELECISYVISVSLLPTREHTSWPCHGSIQHQRHTTLAMKNISCWL